MREILFRGKTEAGEWVEGFLIGRYDPTQKENIIKNAFIDNGTCFYSPEKVIPETVGQYTGLNDKNGKRIFEGDIIEMQNFLDRGEKLRVRFSEDRGGWYPFACGDGCGCCESEVRIAIHCIVIGNIHDNPELLKGGTI